MYILILTFTLVILIYSIGTILPTILLKNIFLYSILTIFLIWCFLYVLKVLIQRLHDSYSSAFWVFGLFIPYVNVYVIYLLLVKGSWQYIESSK
ncbi:DUF805 domain-containing protein [Veillonella atypica]|uniref:DUF805 domain-containing protein n=1 Tax=Veillonella atypica TaxID=39777 RepID=UPI0014288F74